uniref:TsaA-like domain-containing protein n=1 Tax=Globisporangium ultimum (strain ATCC 200006 / CBS 805.95 / DAOM BR144) TaxID=431595 RepID=K3WPV1_GLOUD
MTRKVDTLAALALLQTTAMAAWLWTWWPRDEGSADALAQRVAALEKELQKKEHMRLEERKGRVAAEKELRRVMDDKLDTSKGYFMQSIGHIRSCFKSCLGTPRQGLLAPATKGAIEFQRSISPDTLIGLESFSHVWIVFVFDKNTNGKNARAHEGLRSDSHRYTFKAKISPPMLKERVGIFSTRSPHRPNPIGITLAKVDSVDMKKRIVYISGVDLVNDTPVLDVKPYVPGYDCIADAKAAAWVSPDHPPTTVHWRDPSIALTVRELSASSAHYRGHPDAFLAAIEQVLQVDVRSKDQTKRWRGSANQIVIDNASVSYSVVLPDTNDEGRNRGDNGRPGGRTARPLLPTQVLVHAVTPALN